jgi:flagellar hook assembly protein FlgD
VAEVRIYDASGRMVRELSLIHNRSFAVWDARDQSGRVVAPGVYFVQLKAGGLRLVEKAILTR